MLIAVIEYTLKLGQEERMSELVKKLLPTLEKTPGFISADPASSLVQEGIYYEISYWENDSALNDWAHNTLHLEAKKEGRETILSSYRIIVSEVLRDWRNQLQ